MNTEKELRSRSEAKLHSSILRAEATNVVPVVPHHYFAASSSEIRDMFIDGYFIGTISLSQSVAEGLSKFLCKRKHLPCPKDHLARVKKLLSESIITPEAKIAFEKIEESRNEFQHMNENIESDYSELEDKAKLNVDSLFQIEEEIFGHSYSGGKIVAKCPEFWDINTDDTTKVFLRFST